MSLKITYRKKDFTQDTPIPENESIHLSYKDFDTFENFYSRVYQNMFQPLFAYGMQLCGNRPLVKDCIQELFSELWVNKPILIKVNDVKPYLLKSLRRKIWRELKQGKQLSMEHSFALELSPEVNLINDQEQVAIQKSINTALKSLTDRQREAIYLRFYANISYEEAAEILEINTKATYKLVARALSCLKKAFKHKL
ncbi:sigma-70 family RNA polymerase sigma factor [Flavobacteriaceae bacterium F08102]|nr:sigma-70 family RNA polymerase sigma factor [Flavobacteriaceae bacterium F08102]